MSRVETLLSVVTLQCEGPTQAWGSLVTRANTYSSLTAPASLLPLYES